jgi:DNA-binding CsgD family transcriptional regulator
VSDIELPPERPVKLPPPCQICGQQEVHVAGGIYRINHDMEKHGFPAPLLRQASRGLHDVDTLSIRQREIAELIADGCTDKDIQTRLSVSMGTLREHFAEIARRLNLDASKNLRVQITWLVIDSRYDANPDYQLPTPTQPPRAA